MCRSPVAQARVKRVAFAGARRVKAARYPVFVAKSEARWSIRGGIFVRQIGVEKPHPVTSAFYGG
jgi:hypothetical protein